MSALGKVREWLLGKPATASYKPFSFTRFRRFRDLPPFTFDTIAEMLLDPTIRLGLAMRAAPLSQAEFAFKKGDQWIEGIQADRPEVAVFINRQLKRIWQYELHKILCAQIWGWSAGEVTYRLVNNKVEVDGILHRLAHDTFALHENGEVKGVRFKRVAGKGEIDLRFPRAFWHTYDPEAESSYGISALRGAFSPWVDKASDGGALDTRRLFMHKDAYGGVDMTYPPGVTNIDGKGNIPNRDIAREITEQLSAGGPTQRPAVFDENGKEKWQLTRATVPSSPTHILDFPKDLDVEMLRGLEIPDDVLTSEGSGAWQGKQVPMQAFFTNADRWLGQVVRVIVTQVLEPLVLLNWGTAEEFEVTTKPLAEQALEQIKASEGNDTQGQQQEGQGRESAGAFVNVRGPNGEVFQRRNPNFGRQQLGLDDGNDSELLVGRGELQAAHLVEAGRRLLDRQHRTNGRKRKSVSHPSSPPAIPPSRQELLRRSVYSLGLTRDEADLVERLTHE